MRFEDAVTFKKKVASCVRLFKMRYLLLLLRLQLLLRLLLLVLRVLILLLLSCVHLVRMRCDARSWVRGMSSEGFVEYVEWVNTEVS